MLDHKLDVLMHQESHRGVNASVQESHRGDNASDMCKVQVIYYLNRAGKMEPPHMIEVLISTLKGLRLKDVKDRLNVLRGSGMPNLFSWSYKRNYRSKYIWQDLSDGDLIDPGNGGEYILKGSEILDDNQEKLIKPGVSNLFESRKNLEVVQSKYRGAEIWLNPEYRKLCSSDSSSYETKFDSEENKCCSQSVQILDDTCDACSRKAKSSRYECRIHENKPTIETCSSKDRSNAGFKGSGSSDDSLFGQLQDIKVYKIKPVSFAADYSCDAATQTEQSARRAFKSDALTESTQSSETSTELKQSVSSLEDENFSYSNMTSHYNTSPTSTTSCQNKDQMKTLTKNDSVSNVKLKQAASSSWVFLHILSCGSVDTKLQNRMSTNTDVKTTKYQDLARNSSEIQEIAGVAQASPSREGEPFRLMSRSSSFSSRRSAASFNLENKLERKTKDVASVGTSECKRYNWNTISNSLFDGSKANIAFPLTHVKSSSYAKDQDNVAWLHRHKQAVACIQYRART